MLLEVDTLKLAHNKKEAYSWCFGLSFEIEGQWYTVGLWKV